MISLEDYYNIILSIYPQLYNKLGAMNTDGFKGLYKDTYCIFKIHK